MTMKKYLLFVITVCLLTFFSDILFGQETVTLNASKNNTLYESPEGNISNGSGDHIFAGVTNNDDIRRALLFFDLSDISESSEIVNVELNLVMNRTIAGDVPISIHEVLVGWGEGESNAGGQEGTGTSATNGDATWIHTNFPDEQWQNAGGDFNSTAISSVDVGGSGIYTWPSTDELVNLVQKWLDNPEENYGLLVLGDESASGTAKRFASRHNSTEGDRPALIVEYSEMATSNESVTELPNSVVLNQNFPNPFNPQTVISFALPATAEVELAVHDMLGRRVMTLIDDRMQAGTHEVMLDASGLPSGVYIYNLRTADQSLTRKLTVIK